MHAMACLWKWEQLAFPVILQHHVHDFYQFERLQQVYDNNIFPVIQDQIWYDGITQPHVWKKQAGHATKKQFRKQSELLIPGFHQLYVVFMGKVDTTGGHVQG